MVFMSCSFPVIKKPPVSPNRGLGRKQKSRGLSGARGSHLFLVNPSKTPSSSPCAYEYYDANGEKHAAEQRLMDHLNSLSILQVAVPLYQSGQVVKMIFQFHFFL
jgi:hypothetical protein